MSTELQERVFAVVRDQLDSLGFAPTLAEIGERLDFSASWVNSAVEALVQQGRLNKTTAKTRNLAIAGVPDLKSVGTEAMRAELARRGVTFEALNSGASPTYGTRRCAVDGCMIVVNRGKLMCLDHWRQVSRPTQIAVLDAFRGRDSDAYGAALARAKREAFRGGLNFVGAEA